MLKTSILLVVASLSLVSCSKSENSPKVFLPRILGANGEDLPLQIYPYGLARTQLEQVIMTLQLPIVLTIVWRLNGFTITIILKGSHKYVNWQVKWSQQVEFGTECILLLHLVKMNQILLNLKLEEDPNLLKS